MTSNEQIIIPFSNKKLYKLLLASVLFVLLGIWLLLARPDLSRTMFNDPVIRYTTAIACILFFGMSGIFFIKKIRAKKPAIIIDATGITDNTSAVSGNHIPWHDIRAIVTNQVFNQVFLMVLLHHPEEMISKQTNWIKRKAMAINYKKYGSPLSISASTLQISVTELRALLHDKLSRYMN